MAEKTGTPDVSRRLRLVRYGLLVVVCVAWIVAFVLPFALAQIAGGGWVRAALLPSILYTAITTVVCVLVYQVYKRLVTR